MAHRIKETVALPDEAVEVRQRQDILGPLGPILRDHREPESELREPHCGPVAVHAEETSPEDAASRFDQGTPGAAGSREPVQDAQQERTGADGGVEHANRAQQAENRPVSVGEALLRFRVAAALSPCHEGREGLGQQALHQRGRRVIGARCAPLIRRHHALEHAPQHVRGDATPIALLDGEVEPLEQPVERVSPERIGNVAAEAPLEGVRLEQPAIEEGNRAELGGDAPSLCRRAIERAEEERSQQVAVEPAPFLEAAVHPRGQEPLVAREPSLGLDEIEEQHARELKQGDRVAIRAG